MGKIEANEGEATGMIKLLAKKQVLTAGAIRCRIP
jgi:hypothetical protein